MIHAHCIYEYYNYDLKDEIKIIIDANKLFQEIEIVAAIYCLVFIFLNQKRLLESNN